MTPILLDTDKFPFVITTLAPQVEDENLEDYFKRFVGDVLRRGEHFVSIVDVRPLVEFPSSRLRVRIGEWQKEHPEGDRLNRGIAFITERALVRGFMAAVGLIYQPVVPTVYVATMDEALAFARKRLGF